MMNDKASQLERDLVSYDLATRSAALGELVALQNAGEIALSAEKNVVNMHLHTFFSFNALGHSPTALAWLARKEGFSLAGIVDFDVLDGVSEYLGACSVAGVRGTAGIESRISVPEYADKEINSPGEPGVCYHMGIGFTSSQPPESVSGILGDLGRRADQRNQGIIERVNAYLDPATIDYEHDVLPLTPAGHPTERHMVVAYVRAAERTVEDPQTFWSDKLGQSTESMARIMSDSPAFQNLIRSCLMKSGGVGYVQPESGMFPSLEAFHELIVACGALPCAAWLDGTTAAEQEIEDWLGFLVNKGVVALNLIPDRNWNLADPEVKALKLGNLYHVVRVAQDLDLPLNIGTELNSFGQKLVDDFDSDELAPVKQAFLDGAHFVYGHTVMQQALELGYQSSWAAVHLPARRQRNDFYTELGRRVKPGKVGLVRLEALGSSLTPDAFLSGV